MCWISLRFLIYSLVHWCRKENQFFKRYEVLVNTRYKAQVFYWKPGGVLLGIFSGDVPPGSSNPDPISDQKMPFPKPVFRPGLKNPYPFSDLTLHVIKHMHQCWTTVNFFSLTSYSPFFSQLFLSHQLLPPVAGKKNKFLIFREHSPNNHTQFQTKMFKIYTRFQTKTAQKPYPLGRHIPIYLI